MDLSESDLERYGLSFGDYITSKARQDWGILFPKTVVDDVIFGEWINTNGIPIDRPEGILLSDAVIHKGQVSSIEPYSDFRAR